MIGDLRSTKKNRLLHGLGIPSMRRIAEKYNGYLDVKETESSFQMTFLFVNMEQQDQGEDSTPAVE